jgi:hypothetical protein
MQKKLAVRSVCPHCHGHGYVHLLLGGSATCVYCGSEQKWNLKPRKLKPQIDLISLKVQ